LRNQLNAAMLQLSVRRIVFGVAADREIEGAIGWLDICAFADRETERLEKREFPPVLLVSWVAFDHSPGRFISVK
jgi:hypothetical protein